jgi:hypothetical protein
MYSAFMLVSVQTAALRRADPPSKEYYRLCTDYETKKEAKVQKDCRAIGRQIDRQTEIDRQASRQLSR